MVTRNNSNMNCIAPGCMNWLQINPSDPSVNYHRLPKDRQFLKKWLHVLKRKDVPARASRICRQHFSEADCDEGHFVCYGVGVTDRPSSTSLTLESSKSD
uniref:THAP domain-containing protein 1 n=1 Tax=Oncorhynchus mykiss TaxID=8022 RepID=A0A8K9XDG8_ONCMY